MFSLDINPHASASTRNSRRRQRNGSDDSIILRHNPKRLRRSGLSTETFKRPSNTQTNGDINHTDSAPDLYGHIEEPQLKRDISVDTTSLVIRNRSGKKTEREKRSNRSDYNVELVGDEVSALT